MTKWRGIPWLTKPTIAFLQRTLTPEMVMLEVGSGASTVWFARRVKEITSFEHQREWFFLVAHKLRAAGIGNCTLRLEPNYPVKGIPGHNSQYDFILIDGRGRVQSIKTTYIRLKPGGYLMLDDSQRVRYNEGKELLDSLGWQRQEFVEEGNKKTATVWRRPQ